MALASASSFVACRPKPAQPPSVVIVSFDTLRADRLNVYGYEGRVVSPFIDELAADAVLFENAVSASPWTTPAHLSLMTSLLPLDHGVTTPFFSLVGQLREKNLVHSLPDKVVTLAEALGAEGFATAAFTGGLTLDPSIGFAQGFDLYETSMFKITDPAMADMLGWIDAQQDRPFFLFWHTFETHDPYHVTHFLRDVVPEATAEEIERLLHRLMEAFSSGQSFAEERKQLDALAAAHPAIVEALYDGGVVRADRHLRLLADHLREIRRYDDTLIVLTSDHGEELGERGWKGIFGRHGHNLYQENVAVPLMLKLPGQSRGGTRVSAVARQIDIMPTVLDVMGVEVEIPGLQGSSLRAMWGTGDPGEERLAISEALAFEEEKKSVRSERWKYIVTIPPEDVARHGREYLPEQGYGAELYNMLADPREKTNLMGSGEAPAEVVGRLDQVLRDYVASPHQEPEQGEVSDDTIDRLKALGYVE